MTDTWDIGATLHGLGTSAASNPRNTADDSEQHDFDTYPLELADAADRYMAEDALHEDCTFALRREDAERLWQGIRVARDAMFEPGDPGYARYTDLLARIEDATK